jgi:cadmium resistance protein CadD (predicted permease)
MLDILTIVAIAAGAFIGTNLDNLVLLMALYSRYDQKAGIVAAGYFAGMLLIGAVCIVIGEAGELFPLAYLGMLGVIPIFIGVLALIKLFLGKTTNEPHDTSVKHSHLAIFMAVLMTQLGNGADSIITFSVLYADSTDRSDYLIILTFFSMICLFAWLAYYSLTHRKLSEILVKYGHYVTPFILILVGVYILLNTASDLTPG